MRLGSLSRKTQQATRWWSSSSMIFLFSFFSFYLFIDGNKMENAYCWLQFFFDRYSEFFQEPHFQTQSNTFHHTLFIFPTSSRSQSWFTQIFRGIPSTLTFVQEPFEMGKDVGQGGQLFTILQQLRQVVGNRLWRLDLLMWIVIRLEDMICHHHHFEWDFFCLFLSLFFVFATRKSSLFICAQNFSPTTDCNREIR